MALVVDDHHRDNLAEFAQAVDKAISTHNSSCVAFDCEGENLSRVGTVELVAICFEEPLRENFTFAGDIANLLLTGMRLSMIMVGGAYGGLLGAAAAAIVALNLQYPAKNLGTEKTTVFLVDLNVVKDTRNLRERVAILKRLLESPATVKVIHDCRMDSDALYHRHGIRLRNIHDTSCFHAIEKGAADTSLNDVLLYHGLPQNNVRDNSVYKYNPRYWATRPLTKQMIEWSSSDVDKLLAVASKQTLTAKSRWKYKKAMGASRAFAAFARDMKLEREVVCLCHVGGFVGRQGANIRRLQNQTGTLMYREHARNKFMIYYRDKASLNEVKREMGHSVDTLSPITSGIAIACSVIAAILLNM